MKNEKKKTKKALRRPWKILLSLCLIACSVVLCYFSIHEVYTTISLQNEIKQTDTALKNVKNKQVKLGEMVHKLQDPEYIKMYARGKLHMSKDGEKIIITKQEQEETGEQETE